MRTGIVSSWCIFVCVAQLAAQYNQSALSGRVLDPSGLAVAAASVTLESPPIGLSRSTRTNEGGSYGFSALPAGEYRLTVGSPGFKTWVRDALVLASDTKISLDVELIIGAVTDTVQVTGEAQQVNTTTGEIARDISGRQLQNVGLAGRYAFMMLGLMPGVAARSGMFLSDFRATSYSMGGLQVNGQRKDTNNLTIDGLTNTQLLSGVSMNLRIGVDFVDEVNILTTHYAPEYGRSTGAQINFVTRRGVKDFHGTAFDFVANDAFKTRAFLTGALLPLKYNNPGWTLGGPVYIPKHWNRDKSKLFFFVGQEFRRLGASSQQLATVPTLQQRQLNFSGSSPAPIDPLNGLPFPNNTIPQTRLSQMGQALLKMFPEPNYTGAGGNFQSSRNQPTKSNDFITRLDYNLSSRWMLSGRFLRELQDYTSPYDDTANKIPLFDCHSITTGYNAGVTLTTIVSPGAVNEVIFGYASHREEYDLLGTGYSRSAYGLTFPEIYPGNRVDRIPTINISGYTTINSSAYPSYFFSPSWVVRENFSLLRHSHTLKFGMYYEHMGLDDITKANDNGSFTFGASTQNPNGARNALANAFLGNFDGYTEDSATMLVPYRSMVLEFYAQDSWRIAPRFSLEYGMRYSVIPPWHSAYNNLSAFMLSAWNPAKAPQVAANGTLVPGTGDPYNGILIPGNSFPDPSKVPVANDPTVTARFSGRPAGFVPTERSTWQPRLGFAWDPLGDGKTAVRGGAGVFQGVAGVRDSGYRFGGSPPFAQQASLTNGAADRPASGVLSTTQSPVNITALPDNIPVPLVISYSFGIQRQLPAKTLLDVSYVGNRALHVLRTLPLNFVLPDVQAANQGKDLRPFYPYRGLGTLSLIEPAINSLYSAMQVSVSRRAGKDLTYSLAYTLGKNIGYTYQGAAAAPQDPLDYKSERAEIQESRRHYVVVNMGYELPFLRRQHGAIGRVFGGWQLTGVATLGSGRLYTPALTSVARQIATRPDAVGNPNIPSDQRTVYRWFDTSSFVRPKDFTYGNAGNNVIIGPGVNTMDGVVMKNIRVSEHLRVQYRAEIFNLLNHPYYTDLNTTLGAATYGQIASAGPSRSIQMGLKLFW